MVKQSPHTRWKGCALCKPHKHKRNGDAVRLLTPGVMRQVGVDARWNRHSTQPPPDYPVNPDAEEEWDCEHGCNGDCHVSGSQRCNFTCHPQLGGMFTTVHEGTT